jgi:hypothetical protein
MACLKLRRTKTVATYNANSMRENPIDSRVEQARNSAERRGKTQPSKRRTMATPMAETANSQRVATSVSNEQSEDSDEEIDVSPAEQSAPPQNPCRPYDIRQRQASTKMRPLNVPENEIPRWLALPDTVERDHHQLGTNSKAVEKSSLTTESNPLPEYGDVPAL